MSKGQGRAPKPSYKENGLFEDFPGFLRSPSSEAFTETHAFSPFLALGNSVDSLSKENVDPFVRGGGGSFS